MALRGGTLGYLSLYKNPKIYIANPSIYNNDNKDTTCHFHVHTVTGKNLSVAKVGPLLWEEIQTRPFPRNSSQEAQSGVNF